MDEDSIAIDAFTVGGGMIGGVGGTWAGGKLGPGLKPASTTSIDPKISDKQLRHESGSKEFIVNESKGDHKGYFSNRNDAQTALGAIKNGDAKYLSKNKAGWSVYEYKGVTGYN